MGEKSFLLYEKVEIGNILRAPSFDLCFCRALLRRLLRGGIRLSAFLNGVLSVPVQLFPERVNSLLPGCIPELFRSKQAYFME